MNNNYSTNYFYKLKEEIIKSKNEKAQAYEILFEKSKQAFKAEREYKEALANFFASISRPLTAEQISNLTGGAISKYSISQYFIKNENKPYIGGTYTSNRFRLPNYKTMRTKVICGEQKYALLDNNGNPTNIIITKEQKYRVYWTD